MDILGPDAAGRKLAVRAQCQRGAALKRLFEARAVGRIQEGCRIPALADRGRPVVGIPNDDFRSAIAGLAQPVAIGIISEHPRSLRARSAGRSWRSGGKRAGIDVRHIERRGDIGQLYNWYSTPT